MYYHITLSLLLFAVLLLEVLGKMENYYELSYMETSCQLLKGCKNFQNDKRDDQLGSVTNCKELSDAQLLLPDVDLLSVKQTLHFIEDDTKEGCDCFDVSARVKGSLVGNECGKETIEDGEA